MKVTDMHMYTNHNVTVLVNHLLKRWFSKCHELHFEYEWCIINVTMEFTKVCVFSLSFDYQFLIVTVRSAKNLLRSPAYTLVQVSRSPIDKSQPNCSMPGISLFAIYGPSIQIHNSPMDAPLASGNNKFC